ncbi:MAG: methyltransferase domain-containing protein [Actinobacteria bacterium]|nr:methyltransferase domain-containing protein [Actinomycetota bacterium]
MSADHVERNRGLWERDADTYQDDHAESLPVDRMVWGVWQVPEDELGLLGDVTGLRVLELGCGAAQWSARLASAGAHPVGLDLSVNQLRHGLRIRDQLGAGYPLVAGDAEHLPFADQVFDLVLSDWGAPGFTDPYVSIPEAARVLVPGGALVFCTAHPLEFLTYDADRGTRSTSFQRPYFGLHRLTNVEGIVEFNLTFGAWFDLFRSVDLVVERLVEPQPSEGAQTTYAAYGDLDWGRRFPYEVIWRLRKSGRLPLS